MDGPTVLFKTFPFLNKLFNAKERRAITSASVGEITDALLEERLEVAFNLDQRIGDEYSIPQLTKGITILDKEGNILALVGRETITSHYGPFGLLWRKRELIIAHETVRQAIERRGKKKAHYVVVFSYQTGAVRMYA